MYMVTICIIPYNFMYLSVTGKAVTLLVTLSAGAVSFRLLVIFNFL